MFRIDHRTPKRWAMLAFALLCLNSLEAQKEMLPLKETPVASSTSTQDQTDPPGCGSTEMMEKLFQEHPEIFSKQEQINQLTRERIYGGNSVTGNSEPVGALSGTVYTIPVVVHIVHKTGTPIGTDENLSVAQIQQAIDDLTNSFRNSGAYTNGSGYDVEIEFCLASQDTSGNFTTGITRTASDAYTDLDKDTEDTALKSASVAKQWDPTKYCNIWIVDEICSSVSMSCGVAGYAYLAGAHGQTYDGIVNEASYFGSSTNNSKVHIHEMGHYFNLYHTFNGGCTNNDCTTDGDYVCDTPPDNSTTATCSTGVSSCSTDTDSGPFGSDQPDMTENYMDYGYQSCQYWFTAGQSTRMRDALVNTRTSLLTSNGCVDPSTPAIYFNMAAMSVDETAADTSVGCSGYTDVTITMEIGAAPTGDANVTISYAGTASSNIDYQSTTGPEITFPDGGTAAQTFTLRVWDDASNEVDETVELTYAISGTTDAIAGAFNQTLTLTITDDELGPMTNGKLMLMNEGFDSGIPGDWSQVLFACPCFGSDLVWKSGTAGLTGTSAYISEDGGTTRADNLSDVRRLALATKSIDASSINQDIFLKFDLDIDGDANDYFEIFYNIGAGGWIVWQTGITDFSGTYTATLPSSFQDTSFQLGFVWNSNGDGSMVGDVPAIDNIRVYIDNQPAAVETDLFTKDFYFGPNDTVYIYNDFANDIVAELINLSNHDYGCTTFEIDRTGTSAVMYENPASNSYPASKTFKITPTTNNVTGDYKIKLYYSQTEITGWESATGNPRTDLGLLKASDPIPNVSGTQALGTSPSNGAYNTNDYYVEATFNTGFSGFGAISQSNSPLPIELLSWKARLVEKAVRLEWTSVELPGFDYYEIERSTDGKNFSPIHLQSSSSEVNTEHAYNYNDPLAEMEGLRTVYYRLKNVEQDGSFVLSDVRSVDLPSNQTFSITAVNPNPFNSGLTVSLVVDGTSEVMLEVISVDGRILQRIILDEVHESGTVHLNNLATLEAGIYFLRLASTDGQQSFRKIVKY